MAAVALVVLAAPRSSLAKCPPDSVEVGAVCVDKYEGSVWSIPDPTGANKRLVAKLRRGTATLADLSAAGATQLGTASPPFNHAAFPPSFPENGNWTAPVYAASVPGVLPTTDVTWFQAEQACLLAGKRLPSNREWQGAAAGTPDPASGADNGTTECNIATADAPTNTGSRQACVSSWGAFDMVGNVWERVAEWGPVSTACPGWGIFSDDGMCLSGASTTEDEAGGLMRGGDWDDGAGAGVFAIHGGHTPTSDTDSEVGFRCVR
jgi:formylglycine-generating enzyme required for sulfatase activity